MPAKKKQPVAQEFKDVRAFLARFNVMDAADLNVAAVWVMGTWCFSPMCQWPATFPYLYVTGPTGSGKSVFLNDSMRSVCRMYRSATGTTGSALFRMLGRIDDETGEIENYAPTLGLDEIDASYAGSKDENLRQALNVGFQQSGSTIPRVNGKSTIDFPVYGPKLLGGIDNGHLPPTVRNRSLNIQMMRQTQDQLTEKGIQEFYPWEVDDEAAELQERLAQWAKDHSMVLRDYRATPPEGLSGRTWQIARTLVQLSHAIGNEAEIVASLLTLIHRDPERPDHKVELYQAIWDLFEQLGTDRITTDQILSKLTEKNVQVPGQSGKGLASVLSEDGVGGILLHLPPGHPGIDPNSKQKTADGSQKQRGYYRHYFDGPFLRFLFPEG